MLHNFLNPTKQATAGLSEPLPSYLLLSDPGLALGAGSLDSQLGFAWESPSPAQVAAISDCSDTSGRVPGAKHR